MAARYFYHLVSRGRALPDLNGCVAADDAMAIAALEDVLREGRRSPLDLPHVPEDDICWSVVIVDDTGHFVASVTLPMQ